LESFTTTPFLGATTSHLAFKSERDYSMYKFKMGVALPEDDIKKGTKSSLFQKAQAQGIPNNRK